MGDITKIEKLLYTAKAHTTGGRDGGSSRTSDGHLDVSFPFLALLGRAPIPSSCLPRVGRLATFRPSS